MSTYISAFATAANACQISDKYFWGFDLANGPTPGGGELTADQITVLTVPGLAGVGIEFTGGWLVSGGQIMDSIISYHVATISGTAAIKDATLRITGTLGLSGFAIATEILPGVPGSPLVTSIPSTSSAHIDFSLSPFNTFSVSNEIKVVGGQVSVT